MGAAGWAGCEDSCKAKVPLLRGLEPGKCPPSVQECPVIASQDRHLPSYRWEAAEHEVFSTWQLKEAGDKFPQAHSEVRTCGKDTASALLPGLALEAFCREKGRLSTVA